MMMSLRRLNELFPALSVGPASRDADIAGFAAKLRDELRFPSPAALKRQIAADCEQALKVLTEKKV